MNFQLKHQKLLLLINQRMSEYPFVYFVIIKLNNLQVNCLDSKVLELLFRQAVIVQIFAHL